MEKQTLQLHQQPGASAPRAQVDTQAQDISPHDRAKEHYADVIIGLVKEALTGKTVPLLANAMSFYLAWFFVEYGPVAAGHVFERLGSHISYLVSR